MNAILQPVEKQKKEVEELPDWLQKMIRRQELLNKRYEKAHGEFVESYNEFLMIIEEINDKYGTQFTFQQSIEEFGGEPVDSGSDDDDD